MGSRYSTRPATATRPASTTRAARRFTLRAMRRGQHNWRRYSIMTSLACDPGDFETEDCCAEAALNCDSAGCIGAMMNSRYGWGTPPERARRSCSASGSTTTCSNSQEYVIGVTHNRSAPRCIRARPGTMRCGAGA